MFFTRSKIMLLRQQTLRPNTWTDFAILLIYKQNEQLNTLWKYIYRYWQKATRSKYLFLNESFDKSCHIRVYSYEKNGKSACVTLNLRITTGIHECVTGTVSVDDGILYSAINQHSNFFTWILAGIYLYNEWWWNKGSKMQ